MNKIALVIALLIGQFGFSQVEKKIGDFNKVTTFDKIDVLLIPSKENKVVLNGMDAKEVELVNKNGELKIRMPLTKLLKGDAISATVYYVKIDAVEANEGSRITSDAVLENLTFDIIAKEGSEIKLKLETQRLKIKVTNGSIIHLEGKAQNQDVLINSGGIFKAEKLISSQTIITANAGGDATIFATDFVDAKVRAGGNIIIFGKPKQIDQKVIAGGSIRESNK